MPGPTRPASIVTCASSVPLPVNAIFSRLVPAGIGSLGRTSARYERPPTAGAGFVDVRATGVQVAAVLGGVDPSASDLR